jgi:hypothetical protein
LRDFLLQRRIAQAGIECNLSGAEDATMPSEKQASKRKRVTKAATVKVLGAAGLGSFAGE